MNFRWTGLDATGTKISGTLSCNHPQEVHAQLLKQKIKPITITKKKSLFLFKKSSTMNGHDMALFLRQLATMIEAQVPLPQSLQAIAFGQKNAPLKTMILSLHHDIETGFSLASALKKNPRYFNKLLCNLVDIGEQSGRLSIILEKIATDKEKQLQVKAKILKIILYPSITLISALLISIGLLIFVIPQFQTLFNGFNAQLPAFTSFVIRLSDITKQYWWIFILLPVFLMISWKIIRQHYPRALLILDRASLHLPILGACLRQIILIRLSQILALSLETGIPLAQAIQSLAGITHNKLFEIAIIQVYQQVSAGQSLQFSLRTQALFPEQFIQLVAIGEDSGALIKMLQKAAQFYEHELDGCVENLNHLLEPMIMLLLGTMIGGLVVAMYLPVFKLGSVF